MAVSMTAERPTLIGCSEIQSSNAAMIAGSSVMFVGRLILLMSCMNAHLHLPVQMSTHAHTCAHTC